MKMFPVIKKLCTTALVGLRFQLIRRWRVTFFILSWTSFVYFLFNNIPKRTMDEEGRETVVFGIVSSKKYINDRISALFETSIPDMLKSNSKIIISFDDITKGDIDYMRQRFPQSNNKDIHIVKTNCAPGYDQLPCRTLELFNEMKAFAPDSKWYLKMDDDTMIFPDNLAQFLSRYDGEESLGIGAPCFYYCNEPTQCFHRRSPVVSWSRINSIERTVLGGPGYVLSKSVVHWMSSNGHKILEFGPKAGNSAEDIMLFRSLSGSLDGFKLVQSEAFHFDRPEVSTRYGYIPFKRGRRPIPVSFHLMHNIDNSTEVYKKIKSIKSVDALRPTDKDDGCINHLTRIRNDYLESYERLLTGAEEVLFISNPRDEETFLKQLGHLELLKELGVRPVYIDIMGEKHKSQIFGKEGQVLVFHECKGCFDAFKDILHDTKDCALIFIGKSFFETYKKAEFYKDVFKTMKSAVSIIEESNRVSVDILHQLSSFKNVNVYYGVDVRLTLRLEQVEYQGLPKYDIMTENGKNSKKPKKISISHLSKQKTWLKRVSILHNIKKMVSNNPSWLLKSLRKDNLNEVTELSDDWNFDVNEESIEGFPQEELRILLADYVMFLSRGRLIVTGKENAHLLATLLGIHHIFMAETEEEQALMRGKSIPETCRVASIHTDIESATEETLGLLFPDKTSENNWIEQWAVQREQSGKEIGVHI